MSSSTPNIALTLPVGSERVSRQIINDNNTKIDTFAGKVNTGLDGLRDGIAIVADGDTHAAITSGQFVYVKNHQTLSEGLYTASTNIAANAALSGSNLTADPKGGLNTLYEHIITLSSKTSYKSSIIVLQGNLNTEYDIPANTNNIILAMAGSNNFVFVTSIIPLDYLKQFPEQGITLDIAGVRGYMYVHYVTGDKIKATTLVEISGYSDRGVIMFD